MRVVIVKPNEKPFVSEIENTLAAEQDILGGNVELVYPPTFGSACVLCNEEGKMLGLAPNFPLTLPDGTVYDIICGPAIICDAPIDTEDFASLSDAQCRRFLRMLV